MLLGQPVLVLGVSCILKEVRVLDVDSPSGAPIPRALLARDPNTKVVDSFSRAGSHLGPSRRIGSQDFGFHTMPAAARSFDSMCPGGRPFLFLGTGLPRWAHSSSVCRPRFIPGSSWANLGITFSPSENRSLACSRQLRQASWISCSASTSSPTLSLTFSAAFWKNFIYLLKTVWISSLMLGCRTARRRSMEMAGSVKLVVI